MHQKQCTEVEQRTRVLNWISENWEMWKACWDCHNGSMEPDEYIRAMYEMKELGMIETIMAVAVAQEDLYNYGDISEKISFRALTQSWDEVAPEIFNHLIERARSEEKRR